MPKTSQIPTDTSPGGGDFLLGYDPDTLLTDKQAINTLPIAIGTNPISNGYKFGVYRNAAQNTSAGVFTKVNFDTEEFDTGSNYDNVTNFRFTAPVDGFYQFNWGVRVAATTTNVVASLYKNGSVHKNGQESAGGAVAVTSTGSSFVQATAGNYFEVFIFSNATVGIGVGTVERTYFNGFLVSNT